MSSSTRGTPAELQRSERPNRRRHQPAEALLDQSLDVLAVDVRVTAGHVVLFADRKDVVDGRGHRRVLILPGMAQILRQVTLADQHDADPRYLLQHFWQIFDRARLLAHDHHQDLALWIELPDVAASVILLLRQAPVTRGMAGRIAALARRL